MIFFEKASSADLCLELAKSSFSDSTKKLRILSKNNNSIAENLRRLSVVRLVWEYENDSEIFDLVSYVSAIRDIKRDISITLYLPYTPYARMDRVELEEDIFTLKYFANIINSLHFDNVILLDPHSRVSLAVFDRCFENVELLQIKVDRAISDIKGNIENMSPITVMFPDRGAYERYTSSLRQLFEKHGIDSFVYGEKRRDWRTSNIESFEIRGINSKEDICNVLLIDDIFSSGSTMKRCIDSIRPLAVGNIYIYCTHTEAASIKEKKLAKVLGHCARYYTTSSGLVSVSLEELNKLGDNFRIV